MSTPSSAENLLHEPVIFERITQGIVGAAGSTELASGLGIQNNVLLYLAAVAGAGLTMRLGARRP